jgi:hypothetical protein
MSRTATASLIGIVGFLGYVVLVMLLADLVIGTHWLLERGVGVPGQAADDLGRGGLKRPTPPAPPRP